MYFYVWFYIFFVIYLNIGELIYELCMVRLIDFGKEIVWEM